MTEYYNPGGNQPEPAALTEEERLEKRRFEAGFVFEMMPDEDEPHWKYGDYPDPWSGG